MSSDSEDIVTGHRYRKNECNLNVFIYQPHRTRCSSKTVGTTSMRRS